MFISFEIRRELSLVWFLSMYALELVSHKHGHCSQSSICLNFCVSAIAIFFPILPCGQMLHCDWLFDVCIAGNTAKNRTVLYPTDILPGNIAGKETLPAATWQCGKDYISTGYIATCATAKSISLVATTLVKRSKWSLPLQNGCTFLYCYYYFSQYNRNGRCHITQPPH